MDVIKKPNPVHGIWARSRIASCVALILLASAAGSISYVDSTHVSKPVLTTNQTQFLTGENATISGWISYKDRPTSGVLVKISVTDPSNIKVFEKSVTSDKEGKFEVSFLIPEQSKQGKYTVNATSFCRDVHRGVCTYKTQVTTISVSSSAPMAQNKENNKGSDKIPDWIRNNARWWSQHEISDTAFAKGLEYLVQHGIIEVSQAGLENNDSDKNADKTQLPSWIRKNAWWWSQGKLQDRDFLEGIKYMIEINIIKIQTS